MGTHAVMARALPDDVLADVLGRLPLRSLAVSRCVCKAWRALLATDEHRRLLLPRSVRGLFINYGGGYRRPHFFARIAPAASPEDDGPRIDGKFRFVAGWRRCSEVVDHCNGLVLYRPCDDDMEVMHVCNPTTRRSARLPPYPTTRRRSRSGEPLERRRAFLVFDPAASPDYKVLLEPPEPKEVGAEGIDACQSTEWPPSPWTWHEFSSRTGRWEEKVFVREGEAAGTVWDLLLNNSSRTAEPQWRYAAYWQGDLYVNCRGEYVSRLSLLNDKYKVIKSPIDLVEWNYFTSGSFLGRSEKGVYFAAIDFELRVWMLSESNDETRWVAKHHSNLRTGSWWLQQQKYDTLKLDAPWLLDFRIKKKKKKKVASQQQNVCWNSDDDEITDISDDEVESHYYGCVNFLGFHPYKEVIFLCDKGIAVACHLNSSKVQYLGDTNLEEGIYNTGERESFVYTPCLIGG